MAAEKKRGCGYRKVGGLYLCGGKVNHACDRLPMKLEVCWVCGGGLKFTRAPTKISAFELWKNHTWCGGPGCTCPIECYMCHPPHNTPSYLMWVGRKFYSTDSFVKEAAELGVSKRIATVPKDLVLGVTVVYFAHPRAIPWDELKDEEGTDDQAGVFCAFIPKTIEKLVWESEMKDLDIEALEKRGITPVPIPDGDEDHA